MFRSRQISSKEFMILSLMAKAFYGDLHTERNLNLRTATAERSNPFSSQNLTGENTLWVTDSRLLIRWQMTASGVSHAVVPLLPPYLTPTLCACAMICRRALHGDADFTVRASCGSVTATSPASSDWTTVSCRPASSARGTRWKTANSRKGTTP
jgi:hypothetical protein